MSRSVPTAPVIGRRAERIAYRIWPDLCPITPGSRHDMAGEDARSGTGLIVQIKADQRADGTGNLCWELAKRSGEWSGYGKGTEWHMSPCSAHEYIFVSTENAYRVSVEELIGAVMRNKQRPVHTETSFFFLVKIDSLGTYEKKDIATALRANEQVNTGAQTDAFRDTS